MVIDPVCGMEIEETLAVATINYQGQTYFFCSTSCQHLFEQQPLHYIEQEVNKTSA